MKLSNSLLLVATALLSANAFAPICSPHRAVFATSRIGVAAEGDVAESAMPVADTYDRIGITKDELAIGIDASEFLQWIGT